MYPPIYVGIIVTSLRWLFNWHSHNIPQTQKLAAYAHLYSFASVKSVVHWFQIMRNGKFQMYDDDVQKVMVVRSGHRPSGVTSYAPARFPTRNIASPVVLLYGDCDSLVDINLMLKELPRHTTATALSGYEHLDVIWGGNIHVDVIPHVVEALKKHCVRKERVSDPGDVQVKSYPHPLLNGFHEDGGSVSGYSTPANAD